MRIGTPGFIAARLTEGREARGLTQTSLAEATGIKSQSISHYEQGRQSPSPQALAQLSAALELPARFFLRPALQSQGETVFLSSHGPARSGRAQVERRLAWAKEIAAWLRDQVDFPPVRVPNCPAAIGSDIERIAAEVRVTLNIGSGPVDDLVERIEEAGCIVSWGGADTCSQWDADVPYIALNSMDKRPSWVRLRAAHELGHLVMHRHRGADAMEAADAQADRFARAFLLPAREFAPDVWAPAVNTLLTLKKEWRCPISAMVTRCGEIGVFTEDQVRRAASNVVRRGWKAVEPRENEEWREAPRLLARCIQMVIEEGLKDRHGVVADLAMSASDIEEICGLPPGYLATAHAHPALRLRAAELLPIENSRTPGHTL